MDDTTAPRVPGYRLTGPLGSGSSGQVWRGERTDDALPVAVKVVRSGPDAERELAVLRAVSHPHVVPLRDVVVLDDERLALVTDVLDGGTLAAVVTARGRLRPGEVVTTVAPLAQAVADLHAAGVQHGDIAPGNVLFDLDGRPSLTDLGTVRVTGEPREEVYGTAGYVDPAVIAGAPAGPASDVYGLGALAWYGLCGEPPPAPPCRDPLAELLPDVDPALVAAVESAVDPDPQRRPAPAAFARALQAAAAAEPVWRAGATPVDGGLTHRVRLMALEGQGADGHVARHRRAARPRARRVREGAARCWPRRDAPRRLVAVAAVLTAVGLAVGAASAAGVAGSGTRKAPGRSAASATRAPGRPSPARVLDAATARAVLERLAALRVAALASGGTLHDTGAAPGSPAARQDAADLAALRARGLRYSGLRLSVRSVRVVASSSGRATAVVAVDASAYDVVGADTRVVRHVPAAPGLETRLELRLAPDGGWRVFAVSAGGAGGAGGASAGDQALRPSAPEQRP